MSDDVKVALMPDGRIENAIIVIRGEKVLLDRDLAFLYNVSTSNLNRAVTRNLDRFPDDFMFSLTKDEFDNLKCQFGTSSVDLLSEFLVSLGRG